MNNSLDLFKRIKKAVKIIGKKYGIVRNLYEVSRYNDEPKLFQYSAELYDTCNLSDSRESVDKFAGGASFSQEKAIIKSLGEAFERHCLAIFKKSQFIKTSVRELGDKAINLFSIVNFSKRQLSNKNFNDLFNFNANTQFNWVKGYSIVQHKPLFIPAQLIYVPYDCCDDDKIIRFPITTGAANGNSLEEAIYKGICEIVERDAFIITYLNKLPREKINLTNNKEFSYIYNLFKRYNLELSVFDITSDIEIPSFLAVIIDNTGGGPAVCLGLKASLNPAEGIIGAIEEAQHARPWIRDLILKSERLQRPKNGNFNLSNLEDRALFWSDKKMIKHLNFLLENKSTKSINKILNQFSSSDLKNFNTALKTLNKHNLETVFIDVTTSQINKIGFKVVKVVIPQLQPLYLDEDFKYFGGRRLYDIPRILGYTKAKTKEEDLNKIPHPFL